MEPHLNPIAEIKRAIKELCIKSHLDLNLSTLQEISNAAVEYKWIKYTPIDKAEELIKRCRYDLEFMFFNYNRDQHLELSNEVCVYVMKLISPYVRSLYEQCKEHPDKDNSKHVQNLMKAEVVLKSMYNLHGKLNLFMYDDTFRMYYKFLRAIAALIKEITPTEGLD